jgi:serine protease Do
MPSSRSSWILSLTVGLTSLLGVARADAPKPPVAERPIAVLEKLEPENAADLKAIQAQVRKVLEKTMPATVGIRSGNSSGSGVIISKDGYVLTAGHVSAQPNRDVTVILPDGKTLKAKTLGGDHGIDSGLIKISEEKDYPFVEMGKSGDLKQGQWCIAAGHPGGFRKDRTPPVRLGRILVANDRLIQTDCTVVGGDSGGPLFDLEGKVIGIHSRIGGQITANIHVPIDAYRNGWDRMVKAEVWGGRGNNQNSVFLGVRLDTDAKGCKVAEVVDGSPALKAGLKANDVIAKIDGKAIENLDELSRFLRKKKPGDEVTVEVKRGEETVNLKVKLAKRDS